MKWILYDIGGVLEIVDDDDWPLSLHERWSARHELTVTELRARLHAAELPDMALRSGVADEYWRKLGAALGADSATIATMHSEFWDAYCGKANVELLDHARSLRDRAGLAILSNSGDGAREEEERRFGFASLFDPICYSHEQGIAKPDSGAYLTALRRMGASVEQVLFIDDHEEPVRGAEDCGIRAILHRDNETTIAAIETFLAT
ncbi:HAD family hydrolase [Frondihabitans sp. Leaf304]|uniref:HAD family hydrolase n=1 Tax=Frondihabitans sp. Leaf304 TaxID=1736329 RepID=UPI000A4F13F3|nr:HAD-IA family hydrolase [Frondihabitans sp. Leaf304]